MLLILTSVILSVISIFGLVFARGSSQASYNKFVKCRANQQAATSQEEYNKWGNKAFRANKRASHEDKGTFVRILLLVFVVLFTGTALASIVSLCVLKMNEDVIYNEFLQRVDVYYAYRDSKSREAAQVHRELYSEYIKPNHTLYESPWTNWFANPKIEAYIQENFADDLE